MDKKKKEGKGVEGGASPQAPKQNIQEEESADPLPANTSNSPTIISSKACPKVSSLLDRKVWGSLLAEDVVSSSFLGDLEGSSSKEYGYVIARYLMARWFGVVPRAAEEKIPATIPSFDTKS